MKLEPLHQFKIQQMFDIDLFGIDVSFSNSSLFMILSMASIIILGLLYKVKYSDADGIVKINRIHAASELLYEIITKTIYGTCGTNGLKYTAEIFSLFLFIILCNAFGMIPGGFTVTSHIVVTFAIALTLFIFVNIVGFAKHGLHYFSLFLPKGTPAFLAPLMIVIELFTYLSRPFSLALRLAANMTAGHIVLKVFAAFVTVSGIIGIFPFGMLIILSGFEIFVAILQAYIFTILTCVYLNDAINMH
jgi:F-type H+-transporting ATPase subunit a